MTARHTNKLINETSPYLLQHAHNPVDWHPWNTHTLALAKEQKKLIIVSVGYAACHWCHVMEHESFEDEAVAQVMNAYYVSIKVDREERPDIDQVYMNAVQLMTGAGGWPMNVVALPDGRPVWGGTYFKKAEWMRVLQHIQKLYESNPEKLYEYADQLEQGIKNMDVIAFNNDDSLFSKEFIAKTINIWSSQFDAAQGGMKRAPKFMMPNNYQFLLRFAYQVGDAELQNHVNLTLTKMAYGGVFDHVGGGFSRYSVDERWHVPHFEKMLYDNGQLVNLYADAYLITKNELYKTVVTETLDFIKRDLTGPKGNFYSSLDADSNNRAGHLEEGAYYVWQKDELKSVLKEDFDAFSDYYNVNEYGYWEKDNYVLIRKEDESFVLNKYQLTSEILNAKKQSWKQLLLEERNKRDTPRLDDKTLTSWNALMLKGYVDAYRVFGDVSYLNSAIKNAEFILNNQSNDDGGVYHNYKDGKSSINGFLEDYATTIDAFLALYEQTLDKKWLLNARDLTNYSFDHFFDANSKMFFFTSNADEKLVSRTIEYRDNVMPSSNSMMAKNLFKLGHYFDNDHYSQSAKTMLNNVQPELQDYGSAYSNWLDLMLNYTEPFYDITISGTDAINRVLEFNKLYFPNVIIAGSTQDEDLPLLKHRFVLDATFIYVCFENACKRPVKTIEEAINLLATSS